MRRGGLAFSDSFLVDLASLCTLGLLGFMFCFFHSNLCFFCFFGLSFLCHFLSVRESSRAYGIKNHIRRKNGARHKSEERLVYNVIEMCVL